MKVISFGKYLAYENHICDCSGLIISKNQRMHFHGIKMWLLDRDMIAGAFKVIKDEYDSFESYVSSS